MGGIYRSDPANNIVELGKRVEEQGYPIISAVDRRYNTLDVRTKDLHIRDAGSRGLAGRLHSGGRQNIMLTGRSILARRTFLCIVVIEVVYRGGSITG